MFGCSAYASGDLSCGDAVGKDRYSTKGKKKEGLSTHGKEGEGFRIQQLGFVELLEGNAKEVTWEWEQREVNIS